MSRYGRLLFTDRRGLCLMLLQAPSLGWAVGSICANTALGSNLENAWEWKQLSFILTILSLWCASSISIREIVKERAIFNHERRLGLNAFNYFVSKLVPLGALAILQSLLLLLVIGSTTDFAGNWLFQGFTLSLVSLLGTALGLSLSAAFRTSERAISLLPFILMGQIIFSGELGPLGSAEKSIATNISSSYWSLYAFKASSPMTMIESTVASVPGKMLADPAAYLLGSTVLISQMLLLSLTGILLLSFPGFQFLKRRDSRRRDR